MIASSAACRRVATRGSFSREKRAEALLLLIVPLTILLIFVLLYSMFRSFKWAMLILVNVILERIGGLLALLVTHTNFSVSSGVGFLALFGVSVHTLSTRWGRLYQSSEISLPQCAVDRFRRSQSTDGCRFHPGRRCRAGHQP